MVSRRNKLIWHLDIPFMIDQVNLIDSRQMPKEFERLIARPTSFGQKYGHFSFFCKQMDIFQGKSLHFLEKVPQHQHFRLNKNRIAYTASSKNRFKKCIS